MTVMGKGMEGTTVLPGSEVVYFLKSNECYTRIYILHRVEKQYTIFWVSAEKISWKNDRNVDE